MTRGKAPKRTILSGTLGVTPLFKIKHVGKLDCLTSLMPSRWNASFRDLCCFSTLVIDKHVNRQQDCLSISSLMKFKASFSFLNSITRHWKGSSFQLVRFFLLFEKLLFHILIAALQNTWICSHQTYTALKFFCLWWEIGYFLLSSNAWLGMLWWLILLVFE